MYKSELKLHNKHQYAIKCFGTNFYQKKFFWLKLRLGSYKIVSAKLSAYYAHCYEAIKVDRYMGDYQDYYESLAYDFEYGDGDY